MLPSRDERIKIKTNEDPTGKREGEIEVEK